MNSIEQALQGRTGKVTTSPGLCLYPKSANDCELQDFSEHRAPNDRELPQLSIFLVTETEANKAVALRAGAAESGILI